MNHPVYVLEQGGTKLKEFDSKAESLKTEIVPMVLVLIDERAKLGPVRARDYSQPLPGTVYPHQQLLQAFQRLAGPQLLNAMRVQDALWAQGFTNILGYDGVTHPMFHCLSLVLTQTRCRTLLVPSPNAFLKKLSDAFPNPLVPISSQDVVRGHWPPATNAKLYSMLPTNAVFLPSPYCHALVDALVKQHPALFKVALQTINHLPLVMAHFIALLAQIRLHLPSALLQDNRFVFLHFSAGVGAFYDLTYQPFPEDVLSKFKYPVLWCFTCQKLPRDMTGPPPLGHKLLRCTGCDCTYFCSVDCQRTAYKVLRTHRCILKL